MPIDPSLIDRYADAGRTLREAVDSLTLEQLLAHPVPGTWSIQEIVIHLMDSDLIGIDRMKRIIAEDKPLLLGYNETRFIRELATDRQDAGAAVTIFDLARRQFAIVLRSLPAEASERTGVHNEIGLVTLAAQLKKYQEHFEHHLDFLRRKRQLLK